MNNPIKLTPEILQQIINEERVKINEQKEKIEAAKRKKKIEEIRKELKALLSLKREQKFLIERIKKIQARTKNIKKKIKES